MITNHCCYWDTSVAFGYSARTVAAGLQAGPSVTGHGRWRHSCYRRGRLAAGHVPAWQARLVSLTRVSDAGCLNSFIVHYSVGLMIAENFGLNSCCVISRLANCPFSAFASTPCSVPTAGLDAHYSFGYRGSSGCSDASCSYCFPFGRIYVAGPGFAPMGSLPWPSRATLNSDQRLS